MTHAAATGGALCGSRAPVLMMLAMLAVLSGCYTKGALAATTCPNRDGYTVLADYDHIGDDLISGGNPIDNPQQACDLRADCKGFNLGYKGDYTKGFIKTSTTAQYNKGLCLYTKKVTSCSDREGYTVLVDQDHYLDDLISGGNPIDNPQQSCDLRADCKGFNLGFKGNYSRGFIKSSTTPTQYNRGFCLYTKKVTSCPTKDGYTVLVDQDHYLDDLISGGNPIDNPQQACDLRADCKGYNLGYKGDYTKGFIKSSTTPKYNRGICLYTKKVTTCAPKTGYTVLIDYDHYLDDLSAAISNPQDACDLRADCKGFNLGFQGNYTKGFIKSSTTPKYNRGICLYTKNVTSCPTKDGYTVLVDQDHYLDDLISGGNPIDNPQQACDLRADCAGYNLGYKGDYTKGFIKSSTTPKYNRGLCLYTKKATTCPSKTGYSVLVDFDHYLDDILASAVANPQDACNQRSNCRGFSLGYKGDYTKGFIKTSTTPKYNRGLCLYTKK